MWINHLSLKNFRSYDELELSLEPGVTIFLGRNGEGKTNIVESLLYLAFLSSHRTANDQPLVKLGNQAAYVRAKAQNTEREILVELDRKSTRLNSSLVSESRMPSSA